MKAHALKYVRVVLAVLMLASLTLFFLDFSESISTRFHALAHLQFVPAVLSLSFGILLVLIGITLLFGRIYCSVVCPTGIFQDIAGRCARLFRKKKKRFGYSRPRTMLRWIVVAAVTIAAACGFILLLGLLDPYSIYGRIVTGLFRPLYLTANNWLASFFTARGNYTFYYMDPGIVSVSAFVVALVSFLAIGYMGWRHGRTYCNTVCPVGTVLGFVSRFSLWKVRIDTAKCTSCGVCSARCKGMCIDAKGKTIDNSRCVACYNCLGSCKFDALHYSLPAKTRAEKEAAAPETPKQAAAKTSDGRPADLSRRRFVATSVAAAVAIPELLAKDTISDLGITGTSSVSYKREHPICPPGAQSLERLLGKCTSCHLCVSKCPARIIKPSFTEYGLRGFLIPTVYYEKGFCEYDCTICAEVCPNDALTLGSVEEKHYAQIGQVVLIEENCVVHSQGTNCGACAEHCPTQAVTMVPFRDGLTRPQTDPSICIGCGGCEFICPVRPFRAIYVEGNPVQTRRAEYTEDSKIEMDFDGFGF